MKRQVITIILLIMLVFNISLAAVFAADEPDTTGGAKTDNGQEPVEVIIIDIDPGTAPDETFYDIKSLFENVQLFLTFSAEDKAALLAEFAEKRLAEAQAMDEAGKADLVKEMVEEYAQGLLEAEEAAEVTKEEKSLQEVIEKIEKLLADNMEIINKAKSRLPELEKNLAELKENLAAIKAASKIIEELAEPATDTSENQNDVMETTESAENKDEGNKQVTVALDGRTVEEQVEILRDAGYGSGEITLALTLTEKAAVSIDDIIMLRNEGIAWDKIIKELGITEDDIGKMNKLFLEGQEQLMEETGEIKRESKQEAAEQKEELNIKEKKSGQDELPTEDREAEETDGEQNADSKAKSDKGKLELNIS
ncbi:MAG: DUF5667 domain-containing protein [Peptococcaceae bacterium]